MKLLFVTWNGPEVSYIEGLFLPIFDQLTKQGGIECHILQFTWGNDEYISKVKVACEAKEVHYEVIKVNRQFVPVALLKANFIDSNRVRKYIQANNIDIVMPRATVAASIVLRALNGLGDRVRMLFDADGLQQDERVDFGGWNPSGLQYRVYRDIEFKALRKSDGVLVRSHQAKQILASRAGALFCEESITVINNGRDKNLFSPKFNQDSKCKLFNTSADFPLLVYAGSIGPQYCFEEMMYIFDKVHKHNAHTRFLILTGQPDTVTENLKQHITLSKNCLVKKVAAEDVPFYLSLADIAFALRKPTFSMKAVAPIKLGEYLLCGVPVIATKGIGDTELYINNAACAYLLENLSSESLDSAVGWVIKVLSQNKEELTKEARGIGLNYFDLDKTVREYQRAIQNIQNL